MSTSTRDFHSSLKVGDSLPLQGPSVYQGLTPLNDPSIPDSPSIPPLRPANQALLAQDSPAFSSAPWTIKMVGGMPPESPLGRFQTWRASIKRSESAQEEHIVELILSRPGIWARTSEADIVRNEMGVTIVQWIESTAAHFRYFARLQGREVVYCYGLFAFNLPDESRCFGFVIEEPNVNKMFDWIRRAQSHLLVKPVAGITYGSEVLAISADLFELVMRSETRLQRRLNECCPGFATKILGNYVLDSSNTDMLHFVICGFAVPEPLDFVRQRNERLLEEYEAREGISLMEETGEDRETILDSMQCRWQWCQTDEKLCDDVAVALSIKNQHHLTW